jgi:hypothetical protein
MPDPKDPGALWSGQPEETRAVDTQQIMRRRGETLFASTRSEILISIGAALLFVAVIVWRFWPVHDRLHEFGLAAVVVWALICLSWFRDRIWPRDSADAVAANGLDYYRKELERRRNHLRNEWVFHGPLLLACAMLVLILVGRRLPRLAQLRNALPLLVLLALWTGFSIWRRRRQAAALQRELDELR